MSAAATRALDRDADARLDALFSEWLRVTRPGRGRTDAEVDALVEREGKLERLIAATKARTLRGVAIKARIMVPSHETSLPTDPRQDPLKGMIADLERIAGITF